MSGYPREWLGSTDPHDKTGVAVYKVDGKEYRIKLECLADFQAVEEMLNVAFRQGKHFASVAIRSHIENALDSAERNHALSSMPRI